MFVQEQATEHLNSDLKLIHEWARKWKMIFSLDVNKPAEEINFTNRNITPYDTITFGNAGLRPVDSHKHLGLILDSKLTFNKHLDEKIAKQLQELELYAAYIVFFLGTLVCKSINLLFAQI